QQQYDPGQQQYDPGQQQYDPGQQQYDPGQQQYDPGQQQYYPGQQQYDPGQQQYHPGQQQYHPGQQQYYPEQQQYYPGQQQYDPGQQQYQPQPGIEPGSTNPGSTQNIDPQSSQPRELKSYSTPPEPEDDYQNDFNSNQHDSLISGNSELTQFSGDNDNEMPRIPGFQENEVDIELTQNNGSYEQNNQENEATNTNYDSVDFSPMIHHVEDSPSEEPEFSNPFEAEINENPEPLSNKSDLDLEIEKYQREIEEKQRKMREKGTLPQQQNDIANPDLSGNSAPMQGIPQQQNYQQPANSSNNQNAAQQNTDDEINFEVGSMHGPSEPPTPEEMEDSFYFTTVDREKHRKPVKKPINPKNTKGHKGLLSKFFKENP
ncbi:hypothetical protein QA601_05910, partial [Chitinispirillales bacterium ANBcel5]|uniref:hypothetical protein n=1 Tax=Cellulosispirillum alkaliphilum TaxID=3039283 RepID=UPI002A54E53A|nr:hypothetical protein [Chitinispirillales bacterium ANBcel5]